MIGNAVLVMKIATGEADDSPPDDGKIKAAQELGKKGGKARAEAPLHNPGYDFNDQALLHGASLHVAIARRRLPVS